MADIEFMEKQKELESLLSQYTNTNKSYIENLKNNNNSSAENNLKLLDNLNTLILTHLSENEGILSTNYLKGIQHQETVKENNEKFNVLNNKLNIEREKIRVILKQKNDLNGTKEDTSINTKSIKYKYIYYAICAIILIILIVKSFMSSDIGMVDNVILVCIILLLIYHFFPIVIPYTINKIKLLFYKYIKI
jgi:hypothetical protein